jgi:hypothetical protein
MRTNHGGTIRDEGPFHVEHDRATAACWPERANMRNDVFAPECANHAELALGGELVSSDENGVVLRFLCYDCGPPRLGWAVIVKTMLAYVPVEKIEKGVYRCRKREKDTRRRD